VALCLLLAGGSVAGWLVLSARAEARLWERAWRVLDAQPGEALGAFERVVRRLRGRWWGRAQAAERLGRCHFGMSLCLVRLQRHAEAADAEGRARALGAVSEADLTLLCRAYLDSA